MSHPHWQRGRVRILEHKAKRLTESLVRHGEAVEGTRVKGSTVNREISCLVAALNLAADQGIGEGAPKIKKEREIPRERTLTADEYKDLQEASPRWIQRVHIGANETAMDQGVLLSMTWVQSGLIVVKGGRAKTGAKQRVGISPALAEVLAELRAEYRRTPNTERRVFTREGKPIPKATLRHAFDKAVKDAKIEDFQFRDFRHCARARWAAAGLSFEISEIGSVISCAAWQADTSTYPMIRSAKPSQECSRRVPRKKLRQPAVLDESS